MRLASMLTLAAVAVAGAASASPEDRYGPPAQSMAAQGPARSATIAMATPYRGPFLRWPGKAAPAPTDLPVATPAAIAPQIAYAPPPVRVASLPLRRDTPTGPVAGAYPAPRPFIQPASPPPAAPPPARTAPTARLANPFPRPSSPSPPAAAPPVVYAATGPAAGGPAAPVRARFYSLHRDYGDTPDRISLPASRPPVLIGPASGSTANAIGEDPDGPGKPSKDSPAF